MNAEHRGGFFLGVALGQVADAHAGPIFPLFPAGRSAGARIPAMKFDLEEKYGMWMVVDASTREVVKLNDRFLEGLSLEDADDLVDLLNATEANRPPKNN